MDEKNPLASVAAFHFNQHYQQQRLDSALKSVNPSQAGHTDPKLKDACREMESLFLNYLLKELRKTINKSGFISGGKARRAATISRPPTGSLSIATKRSGRARGRSAGGAR